MRAELPYEMIGTKLDEIARILSMRTRPLVAVERLATLLDDAASLARLAVQTHPDAPRDDAP